MMRRVCRSCGRDSANPFCSYCTSPTVKVLGVEHDASRVSASDSTRITRAPRTSTRLRDADWFWSCLAALVSNWLGAYFGFGSYSFICVRHGALPSDDFRELFFTSSILG